MPHPVVLALFDDTAAAAAAAGRLRSLGVPHERVSVVARSRDEEGRLAEAADASPGAEIDVSLSASRLGEFGAHLLAAVALVMPGIGPIVADGPLAADLAEAAGRLAGDVGGALERAGVPRGDAQLWASRVADGAILVGAHVAPSRVADVQEVLRNARAEGLLVGSWPD